MTTKKAANPLHGKFDEMVNAVLKKRDVKVRSPKLNTWDVSSKDIILNDHVRLDAEHYDPTLASVIEKLKGLNRSLMSLADISDVSLPGKFARIWADNAQYGAPYANATDLMSIMALGKPAQSRFLSFATDVDIEKLRVYKGTILLTCSGTLGRVFPVTDSINGWAATHDLIRIKPRDSKYYGYIFAYLCSEIAQVQLLSQTHGGQIDHITDKQIEKLLIPSPTNDELRLFNSLISKSEKQFKGSIGSLICAISKIGELFNA